MPKGRDSAAPQDEMLGGAALHRCERAVYQGTASAVTSNDHTVEERRSSRDKGLGFSPSLAVDPL